MTCRALDTPRYLNLEAYATYVLHPEPGILNPKTLQVSKPFTPVSLLRYRWKLLLPGLQPAPGGQKLAVV